MKILLTMNLPYFGDPGFNNGATKANRYLCEGFAARHHQVLVVVPTLQAANSHLNEAEYLAGLVAQGVVVTKKDSIYTYMLNGVEVHAVGEMAGLRSHLSEQIHQLAPDWVMVSCEDWAQGLLELTLKSCPSRVVYLCLSPTYLPFGPQAFVPNAFTTELLSQTAAIIAGSYFIEKYIRQWSSLEASMIYWPSYEPGPFPEFGCFDAGFVTMINPCDVKGIGIFLDLARHFTTTQFAVVPTWGTTPDDRAALSTLPNVQMLKAVENIDEIFARTRILVMPTLFPEGVGLTTVEAMLCGIPVLASDVGALPEMKLGVDFLLPVRPIEQFSDNFDPNLIPKPVVPEQDSGPWLVALAQVLEDRHFYEQLSATSRARALEFVTRLSVEPFEQLLARLEEKTAYSAAPVFDSEAVFDIDDLSPEQQELLLLWMSQETENQPDLIVATNGRIKSSERVATPLGLALIDLWSALFPDQQITAESDFYGLGGDASLLAQMAEQVTKCLGQPLSTVNLEASPLTIASLESALLQETTWVGTMLNHRPGQAASTRIRPLLVHLQPQGVAPPIFFAAPLGGVFGSTAIIGLLDLARQLAPDQPFYGLQAPALAADPARAAEFADLWATLEQVVEACLGEIQTIQSQGPYYLGGFCSGGLLAVEIAQALRRQGHSVANILLIDPLMREPTVPTETQALQDWEAASLAWFAGRDLGASGWDITDLYAQLCPMPTQERWLCLCTLLKEAALVPSDTRPEELEWLWNAKRANEQIVSRLMGSYTPCPYSEPATILVTDQMGRTDSKTRLAEMQTVLCGPIKIHYLDADHGNLFISPQLQSLSDCVRSSLLPSPSP